MGKKVRRMVRKERDARPWLEKSDEPLLSMLCELRILKDSLIVELHRKGILGAGASPSRRLLELEKINGMILRVEATLPARPETLAFDPNDPDMKIPVDWIRRVMADAEDPE